MRRHAVLRTVTLVMGFLLMVGTAATPVPAAALDVYVTPGTHQFNGRTWRTTCSSYTTTVDRCRTEIIATTVVASRGRFVATTDWTFNNLTYKASPRAQWAGNPLATPGEHTIAGRRWRTECDTAVTGRNGCRSWIQARVVAATSLNPIRYGWVTRWEFNNMVRFSVPGGATTPPTDSSITAPTSNRCKGVPVPAGYSINAAGMPHPAGQPGQYHPNHIGNFIRQVLKDTRTSTSQKKCLATQAGQHLLAGSRTRVVDGATSRWFPYNFNFSANPAINDLKGPWYSGLAQANVLTLSLMMQDLTGDASWRRYGRETFESFLVPRSNGGFATRENGFLWFEEYPTQPPTSVLNGHLEALIGLSIWGRDAREPRATALVRESTAQLDSLLSDAEVETPAGLMSTYDLVRGHPAAPLRLVPDSTFHLSAVRLNGSAVNLPVVARTGGQPNVLRNSDMTATSNGLPSQWQLVGSRSQVAASDGGVRLVTDGRSFQGVSQSVGANTFAAGEPLTLSARSRLTVPGGKSGTSGKVIVYERCSSGTRVIFTTTKTRSPQWASQDMAFKAPLSGCSMEVRLTSGTEGPAGTVVEFDDVTLSRADAVGGHVTPSYDLLVHRSPVNTVTLSGTGAATLQAHADGRWRDVASVSLSSGTSSTVVIPERLTGRNLHWGYHENHVAELMALHRLTNDPVYLKFARRWAPLSPAQSSAVPTSEQLAAPELSSEELPTLPLEAAEDE